MYGSLWGWSRSRELTGKEPKGIFWAKGNDQYLNRVWVTWVQAFVKTHGIVYTQICASC